jgi:hypothetical protein
VTFATQKTRFVYLAPATYRDAPGSASPAAGTPSDKYVHTALIDKNENQYQI